jgi:hypothetical protein
MTLPKIKRTDFSNGLVHLTRERIEYKPTASILHKNEILKIVSPFEVLKEILNSGTIRASGNEGFIKGDLKATCFTEVPLSAVPQFASTPQEAKARYRFYGISLSKKAVFMEGGRPVIYLPDSEAEWIPPEHRWRHVRYEHGIVDFTHEREWRVPGDFDLTTVPGLYLLVWSTAEAREIYQLNTPVQNLIRGVLPMEHLTQLL